MLSQGSHCRNVNNENRAERGNEEESLHAERPPEKGGLAEDLELISICRVQLCLVLTQTFPSAEEEEEKKREEKKRLGCKDVNPKSEKMICLRITSCSSIHSAEEEINNLLQSGVQTCRAD